MVLADDFASAVRANPDRREADALLAERIDNPRLNQITEAEQHAVSLLRIILWAPQCRFVTNLRILVLVIVAKQQSAKGLRPHAHPSHRFTSGVHANAIISLCHTPPYNHKALRSTQK